MRWLLVKDLQVMRRSPLVTALLVIYPVAIAVLIGFALSRGPSTPRVAFVNQVPEGEQLNLGGTDFSKTDARAELCSRIDCVDVPTAAEARQKVESGDVLGALILPRDFVQRLQSLNGLNPVQPLVRVMVNEEDPVKAGLVNDRISALVTEANLKISQAITRTTAQYVGLLIHGGNLSLLGQSFQILGLGTAQHILEAVRAHLPKGSPLDTPVGQVIHFARLARQNLNLAKPFLSTIAHPIEVRKQVVSGSPPSLDNFAIAVAATVTLMFVTVLLVAGSLALEREENAFVRLVRGLVPPFALLGEKVLLGIVASLVVTLLMLAGLTGFVDIDWSRAPLIVAAIVVGGAAFAAFGAAIGSLAREVRASAFLAFMVALPVAFISLVPSGTVSAGLFHVIQVIRALFPFQPALSAMSGGLDAAGPGLGVPLLHLGAIVVAYGLLARVSLRRFA